MLRIGAVKAARELGLPGILLLAAASDDISGTASSLGVPGEK
jgi:hypothetical protein